MSQRVVSYLANNSIYQVERYKHTLQKLTGILMSLLRLVLGIERVLAFWS